MERMFYSDKEIREKNKVLLWEMHNNYIIECIKNSNIRRLKN